MNGGRVSFGYAQSNVEYKFLEIKFSDVLFVMPRVTNVREAVL